MGKSESPFHSVFAKVKKSPRGRGTAICGVLPLSAAAPSPFPRRRKFAKIVLDNYEIRSIISVFCSRRRIGGDGGADTELLTQGPFVMNIRNRTLEKQGERIRLTQVEFSILKLFMQNPGRALSREDILAAVWGPDYEGELKIVDVNIRRLRIKIEDNATTPKYITTVWGFGYKWGA